MKELSLEKMEDLNGGMSFACGLSLAGLGVAAIGLGALSGGVGLYGIVAMLGTGLATTSFMTSCGPYDFY